MLFKADDALTDQTLGLTRGPRKNYASNILFYNN